tara:strand:- start:210 stop:728 length:519 start_codon:yes stop_codon:yes gene_type:complete
MTMKMFIDENRGEIDAAIRGAMDNPNANLDDDEREMWINNDEGLYSWAYSYVDEEEEAVAEHFKSIFGNSPNMMTPNVLEYGWIKKGEKAYELSEGYDMNNDSIYGVTVITINPLKRSDDGMLLHDVITAREYIEDLIQSLILLVMNANTPANSQNQGQRTPLPESGSRASS